ncbi:glycerophosphodiester phosphodiesterase family protein [Echinicola sediminis]
MKKSFSTKRILLTFCTLLIVHFSQGQVEGIQDRFLKTQELMIIAHRAAHEHHPENSLPAIQEAIDLGVDMVELDIRVTADGVPVIMHDGTVDRTTNGKGHVEDLDFETVQGLYLLKNGEETHLKVPSLREALMLCKGKIMVDMDMKTDQVEQVLEVVEALGMVDQVIFYDADWNVLRKIKSRIPEAMLMPRAYKPKHIKKAHRKLDPVAIHIDPSFYSPKTITLARTYGMRVWINSLGERDEALKSHVDVHSQKDWLSLGANMVQTDLPAFWVSLK